MTQSGPASAIADEAPWCDGITAYDQAHLALYARLLDARADGAEDDEVARLVLEIDPGKEPDRAKRCLVSHMSRAHWLTKQGYRDLLAE